MATAGPWLDAGPHGPDPHLALVEGLRAAVPWWATIHRQFCQIEAARRSKICATTVGSYGDALQWRSRRSAETFNRLAEGVAIAATQPGGITVFGLHFQAPPLPEPSPGCTLHWCPRGGRCRTTRGTG